MVYSPCFLLPSQVVHLVYPGLAEHPHPVLVALHGPVGGGDGQQELSQLLGKCSEVQKCIKNETQKSSSSYSGEIMKPQTLGFNFTPHLG